MRNGGQVYCSFWKRCYQVIYDVISKYASTDIKFCSGPEIQIIKSAMPNTKGEWIRLVDFPPFWFQKEGNFCDFSFSSEKGSTLKAEICNLRNKFFPLSPTDNRGENVSDRQASLAKISDHRPPHPHAQQQEKCLVRGYSCMLRFQIFERGPLISCSHLENMSLVIGFLLHTRTFPK